MVVSDAPAIDSAAERDQESQDLVERIRSGDLAAFEGIIRLHERRILGMAVQMGLSPADAQDVCQEVFIRVFKYLAGFRAGRSFRVWLWRIALNVVYDALAKRRDRYEVSWEDSSEDGKESTFRVGGLHLSVENADLCSKLLARMEILTPQERMVFVLRDLQELDTAEIARVMRISPITVRRHGASARQKLREIINSLNQPSRCDFQ